MLNLHLVPTSQEVLVTGLETRSIGSIQTVGKKFLVSVSSKIMPTVSAQTVRGMDLKFIDQQTKK